MAVSAPRPVMRELALIALIAADGSTDKTWAMATKSAKTLKDLVNVMPVIRDPGHRASLYPKVEQLLTGASKSLETADAQPIRWAAMTALTSVRGKETDTVKSLARFVSRDEDRHAAVGALLRIPAVHWTTDEARPVVAAILGHVRKVPAKNRTTPAARDALQLADTLTSTLPPAEAKSIRKELGDLGVRVIRIGTVPDQMLFDQERIAVQAGKPVEIHFVNTDLMPHNLVVVQPGALEEIGTLAENTATTADAMQRHYVPRSPKILLASRLLQPREAQQLQFTAPTKPGIYPLVCTYPGHWRRMYGAMYVVDDLDEYLADADGYLAKHRVTAADPLLKSVRPRVEWKFDDLAPVVETLANGRSFANGKQMFQVASCVTCHKMDGAGVELGADLSKLDPKQQKPIELLRDLLEPSFRINEKYQTHAFELQSGKVVTGLVLEETPELVKVIENPLVKAEPVTLQKSEIVERSKSPTSIMPKGLLDKLTREEILDLIAYVLAAGDSKHALFQGGDHNGHRH
jgi:putative heme-binding domain-containing protein